MQASCHNVPIRQTSKQGKCSSLNAQWCTPSLKGKSKYGARRGVLFLSQRDWVPGAWNFRPGTKDVDAHPGTQTCRYSYMTWKQRWLVALQTRSDPPKHTTEPDEKSLRASGVDPDCDTRSPKPAHELPNWWFLLLRANYSSWNIFAPVGFSIMGSGQNSRKQPTLPCEKQRSSDRSVNLPFVGCFLVIFAQRKHISHSPGKREKKHVNEKK